MPWLVVLLLDDAFICEDILRRLGVRKWASCVLCVLGPLSSLSLFVLSSSLSLSLLLFVAVAVVDVVVDLRRRVLGVRGVVAAAAARVVAICPPSLLL